MQMALANESRSVQSGQSLKMKKCVGVFTYMKNFTCIMIPCISHIYMQFMQIFLQDFLAQLMLTKCSYMTVFL